MSNDARIKEKMKTEKNNFSILAELLQNVCDNEKSLNEERKKAFTELAQLQETDNSNIRDIYKDFSNAMLGLENDRKTFFIDELEQKLVPIAYFYPEDIKTIEKNLSEIEDIGKEIKKKEESKSKIKPDDKASSKNIDKEIVDKKNDQKNKCKNSVYNLCKYEFERICDTKNLLLHYIFSEMKFHAQSLQKISELFHTINENEPLENIEEFKRKMNINIDLKDCGVNIAEINKQRDRKLMNERNNAKKVFESQEE